jgi:acyl-CoA dehydrogenase
MPVGNKPVIEAVREITERYDRRYWLSCVEQRAEPDDIYSALADAGLLGLDVPEAFGGRGGNLSDVCQALEELGSAGVPMGALLVTSFVRQILLRHASRELQDTYVPATSDGTMKLAFANTEADAGSNMFNNQTVAKKTVSGSYLISGAKIFISGAGSCDAMMVVCRTEHRTETKRPPLSLIMVPRDSDGLTFTPMDIAIKMSERQFMVSFDEVEVPAKNLIGEEGMASRYVFSGLNSERIITAAQSVGIARYALGLAKQVIASPLDPSRLTTPVGVSLRHRLADAYAQMMAARVAVGVAVDLFDRGLDCASESSIAKYVAANAGVRAVTATDRLRHLWSVDDRLAEVMGLWPFQRLVQSTPLSNDIILSQVGERCLGLPRAY